MAATNPALSPAFTLVLAIASSCRAHQPKPDPSPPTPTAPTAASSTDAVPAAAALRPGTGACTLRTHDASGQEYVLRRYDRDDDRRIIEALTFDEPAWTPDGDENLAWKDTWARDASGAIQVHRWELWGHSPSPSNAFPFTCVSDSTMASVDGTIDGWERWPPKDEPLSYHARGVGLDRALRCADNRWDTRADTPEARYEHAYYTAKTLRLGDPGCAWCYLDEVSPELFSPHEVYDEEGCDRILDRPGAGSEEARENCDDSLAHSSHDRFAERPQSVPFVFTGGRQWSSASRDGAVVAEARWGEDGLPRQLQLPQCGTTLRWDYEVDAQGRVTTETRMSSQGETTWIVQWGESPPSVPRRMEYSVAGRTVVTLAFDGRGDLVEATVPLPPASTPVRRRAPSDGTFRADYECWGEELRPRPDAWIGLVFELAADPTVPEQGALFTIPQFVHARVDHERPLEAAGVWGTGRGPISDLDLAGRFGPYWCASD